MAIAGRERGAALTLNDPLLLPPDIVQYQAGPVTYRAMTIGGRDWIGVFEAEHDGIGWFVVRTSRRPLVLLPDDWVHYRMQVVEDHGSGAMLKYHEEGRGDVTRLFKRSGIVFLEEKPGAILVDEPL